MEIIDAYWEIENLGKRTAEINIEPKDSIEKVKEDLKRTQDEYEYIVIKVPILNLEINKLLSEMGFYFVETQMSLLRDLQQKFSNQKMIDFSEKRVRAEKINSVEQMYEEIFESFDSNMFVTDRIYLDKNFKKGSCEKRYKNWMLSTFEENELYKLVCFENIVGFFYGSFKDNCYYGLLGGIFSNYKNLGLGFSIIQKPLFEAKRRKKRWFRTKISSNNKNVLDIYQGFDFKVESIKYIFVEYKKWG